MLGKSDRINNPNPIYFDKVKSNLVVHFFILRLNNGKRFIYTVELGEDERKKQQSTKNELHILLLKHTRNICILKMILLFLLILCNTN